MEAQLGHRERAIERMEAAYAVIGNDEPDADLGLLLTRLGGAYYFAGDREQAVERIERALDIAEALQLPELLIRGWTNKAMMVSSRRPAEARGLFQLALDTALAHDEHTLASLVYANLSDVALRGDRYSESLAYLEQSVELSHRIGDRGFEWFALSEMTYALTMLGRWDEALARLVEIPDEQIGANTQLISPLTGILELYLQRGEVDLARRLLGRFEELGRAADIQAQGGYEAATAAVRLAEGDLQGALAIAEQAFARRRTVGVAAQDVKMAFLHTLEAAVALGERDKADDLLVTVEELPTGLRPPMLDALAKRFRARLAGDDPRADGHFTAAAAQFRVLELPFYLAVVLLEHGEWLTARGRPDDAGSLLAEARETFERLGATPWLERAEGSLPAGREPEPVGA